MFRQLECFIQICKEGSFTKAAEVLMTTQPTLSQQIRSLEVEVGTPLFERVGRGVRITADGEILYEKALSVMRLIDESKKETYELRNARANKLSIGISPMDFSCLVPRFLKFHEQYPDITLKFASAENTSQQILSSSIDIGIADNYNPNKEIHMMHLYKEEQALVVYADHPWADRTFVFFHELEELESSLFVGDISLIEHLHTFSAKIAKSLQSKFESTSTAILLSMVLHKMGVAILPTSLIENFSGQQLKMIRLVGPTPVREIKLIFKKYHYNNPSVQKCIDFFLE
ncbi:LysR family transcriptional regulator [Brevibacillus reuszeri]|uniref:LysR family transcriptional regulator n=1 Tax=Brevibacillus reuszeri TaxID=54915 RepID=A0A0K9YUE3_9BACL|nr:LysR family transcriptional regulator [Brevibacillus reuszeri]KNB72334.1 LysR family transcriptional regulator [Brevibacillus reuszeri]MED1861016.1 LysR family transcriptional regulator [Brevibacillus reuszeri]GED70470.1 LysR family transcriptional regulator [Brevibacillus reuszeri]